VVDHVEAVIAAGPVDRGDVDHRGEGAGGVVAQIADQGAQAAGGRVHGQFAMGDVMTEHRVRLGHGDHLAKF
jgi:hypothetical protein